MSNTELNKSNDQSPFDELNQLASGNHDLRNELIKKLFDVVKETDFNPNAMRASDLESRLGMVSTIDSLMKSQESVQINKIKLDLQKKKDNDESDHSTAVLELLQKISPNLLPRTSEGNVVNVDEADSEIEKRISAEGIEISEGELEKVSVIE